MPLKINTDPKLIKEFLTRGVENIYPTPEALEKVLRSGKRLKIYQGFDPTGPFLHVGHAIGIRALRILQQLGHEVVFLVGDYTSKVGDPDKETGRKMMSDAEIEKNMAGWKKQAAQLIDFGGKNPVKFERNYKWLSKLQLEDVLKLMSHTTIQRLSERDMFARRLKAGDPINFHELIYPLLQGYDGVAMKVDMEIGGADQTFNMLMGRHLSQIYLKKEKFVRTNKMMDAPDGRTMSKTKGNGINLGDSAEQMFGKAMSYPDSAIPMGLELLTEISLVEIANIQKEIAKGENPMQFKKLMAFEIVKTIKGEKEAVGARDYFEKTVQHHEAPANMPKVHLTKKEQKINVVDLFMKAGLVQSKTDARRLIEQGGLSVDGAVVKSADLEVSVSDGSVLKKGKRFFAQIIIE